jgi:transglutaminase-like putative cysteine protease
MIYDIRHVTLYEYGSSVTFSHCSLRLLPQTGPGQKVLSTRLLIDPEPREMIDWRCFFGNRVTSLTIATPHRKLVVEALASVEVSRPTLPDPKTTLPWEAVRDAAFGSTSLAPDSPAHFLHPSRFVPRFQAAADYAAESFLPERPILDAGIDLMHRMRKDFKYDPKATVVSTPLSEAFAQRSGVCQDFAHIMIAGLRGLGLPAAYVSGYIRTIPPEGKERLEGADATHAWVALWCGAALGFVGIDPTNSIVVGNDHISLAHGRDYADVSPVAGIVLGAGDQEIEVMVDVVPRREDAPPLNWTSETRESPIAAAARA